MVKKSHQGGYSNGYYVCPSCYFFIDEGDKIGILAERLVCRPCSEYLPEDYHRIINSELRNLLQDST